MKVHIKISSTLRPYVPDYKPETGMEADLPDGCTLQALAERLNLPLAEIKFVMLNGRHQPLDAVLRDGDRAAFFPAVGGG